MDQAILRRISSWGKFVGITTMVIGGLYTLLGLFAFIIGAIPGIIMFFMGYFIYKMGRGASEYLLNNDKASFESLLSNLGNYLVMQGVLLIIVLVIILVILLFSGLSIFFMLNSF